MFPRSHDKYKFQDPEAPRSHNLESYRVGMAHFQGQNYVSLRPLFVSKIAAMRETSQDRGE